MVHGLEFRLLKFKAVTRRLYRVQGLGSKLLIGVLIGEHCRGLL